MDKLILLLILSLTIVNISGGHGGSSNSVLVEDDHRVDQTVSFNIIDDINSIERIITCDMCTWVIHTVQDMIVSKKSELEIQDFIIDFCTIFKIEKAEVCQGIIPLFANETFDILGNHSNSPSYICGFVGICPFNPANFTGIVPFPKPKPPHVDPVPPVKGGPVANILHLSDIHVDTLYVAGMNNDCGEPICCRAHNGPGSGSTAAGYWGDYACDINMNTLTSMLESIAQQHTIDYIFWTGDNPPHDVWMQTRETQLNASRRITALIEKYFPGVPVFPAIGNHESLPVNSFPLPPASNWLFDALSVDWEQWFQGDQVAIETLRYGGYYSLLMPAPLQNTRVVSLNMNWCNDQNLWLVENVTDAAGMISWLVRTLQEAEDNQERVYIIGHIPTGILDCIDIFSQQFYQIVDRYEDTIISLFFGHTHRDTYEVYHTATEPIRPTAVAYIAPSTTTFQNQNPSYRIYQSDIVSSYLVESSTYHTNIIAANAAGQNAQPIWQLEYNASTSYGLVNLFPQDWDDLTERMMFNSTLLNTFYNHIYSSSPYPLSNPCTSESCINSIKCELISGYYNQYKECMASSAKGSFLSLFDRYQYINSIKKVC